MLESVSFELLVVLEMVKRLELLVWIQLEMVAVLRLVTFDLQLTKVPSLTMVEWKARSCLVVVVVVGMVVAAE
jgi:hypothetical protein